MNSKIIKVDVLQDVGHATQKLEDLEQKLQQLIFWVENARSVGGKETKQLFNFIIYMGKTLQLGMLQIKAGIQLNLKCKSAFYYAQTVI